MLMFYFLPFFLYFFFVFQVLIFGGASAPLPTSGRPWSSLFLVKRKHLESIESWGLKSKVTLFSCDNSHKYFRAYFNAHMHLGLSIQWIALLNSVGSQNWDIALWHTNQSQKWQTHLYTCKLQKCLTISTHYCTVLSVTVDPQWLPRGKQRWPTSQIKWLTPKRELMWRFFLRWIGEKSPDFRCSTFCYWKWWKNFFQFEIWNDVGEDSLENGP